MIVVVLVPPDLVAAASVEVIAGNDVATRKKMEAALDLQVAAEANDQVDIGVAVEAGAAVAKKNLPINQMVKMTRMQEMQL